MGDAFSALDDNHMAIRCPRGGGSQYFIYHGFYSIAGHSRCQLQLPLGGCQQQQFLGSPRSSISVS